MKSKEFRMKSKEKKIKKKDGRPISLNLYLTLTYLWE